MTGYMSARIEPSCPTGHRCTSGAPSDCQNTEVFASRLPTFTDRLSFSSRHLPPLDRGEWMSRAVGVSQAPAASVFLLCLNPATRRIGFDQRVHPTEPRARASRIVKQFEARVPSERHARNVAATVRGSTNLAPPGPVGPVGLRLPNDGCALREATRASVWRDIAEAPRGESVLLRLSGIGFMVVGKWSDDGNWYTSWEHDLLPSPTHFQPLPAAPSGTLEDK